MRKFLIIFIMGAVWFLPRIGYAQDVVPTPPAQITDAGISPGKLLAIGVGVVVGSVVLETLAMGQLSGIAGGLIGGVIGNWWYNHSEPGPKLNITRYMESSASVEDFKLLKIVRLAR